MRNKVKSYLALAVLVCVLCSCAAAETSFQSLCRQRGMESGDVIAWLEIPGAVICEPVMRRPGDDSYYATRAADGRQSTYGSLYVQAQYNAADFSDPVTLVYGSSAAEAAPFGTLQEVYSASFDQCRTLYVHKPDETCAYTVFAAIPYSSIHILHYYDFNNPRRLNSFFDSVFSTRALAMHLDEDNRPEAGEDQVIILSTGLRGDPLQRYLVMARKTTL